MKTGFSLVELMIVVAMVGILSVIAIPNYQNFVKNARRAEGKGLLSGIYTAEKGFFGEYSSYSTRLDAIGFAPEGIQHFDVGFKADFAPVGPLQARLLAIRRARPRIAPGPSGPATSPR